MYKLIIFDLDGTLLHTLPDIYAVLNGSLRKFSLPEISLDKTRAFIGNGAKTLVKRVVGDDEKFEEVYRDYSVRFAECENSLTTLFDGEECALSKFKDEGIKLAIVTNKPQKATENVVHKLLDKFAFDFIVGQTASNPLKPDPTTTLKIIKALNLKKEECLFVGDGETDVQTAHSVGIDCISVLWGYRSREQLENVGAKHFVRNWNELTDYVFKN